MKFKKFVTLLLVFISLALIGLSAAPQTLASPIRETGVSIQAPQLPAPMTWILKNDFRVSPNQANPNPDSYGHANTWSFMRSTIMHDPTTYHLITQFYPDIANQLGIQGWVGPDQSDGSPKNGAPDVDMNTRGVAYVISPGFVVPPGVVVVHPDPSQPAIVRWRSPFTGALAIVGGVTDVNGNCGDGILWFIDKNSTTIASGSYPNGGAQLFKDGTHGNQLGNIPVNKGDSIYFLVAPGGNWECDSTQLDVTITTIPPVPTLVSPANNATVNGSSVPMNVTLDWNDVAYATRYKVVVKDAAMNKVVGLTVYGVSTVKVNLVPHKTYYWNVQACNSGGCSNKSATWKFKN